MAKFGVPKATTAVREAGIPLEGEVLYDKDKKALFFGDGTTTGGVALHSRSQETAFVYGIDYDKSNTSAAGVKVVLDHSYDYDGANTALRYHAVDSFAQTPAHAFRGVLRDLENGEDVCFLDISDSTKKADGTSLTADEKLGKWTSGGSTVLVDFMNRIPITYWRIDHYSVVVDNVTHDHVVWLVSDREFVGSSIHPFFYTSSGGATASVQYVAKFKGVLCDSSGNPKTQSAESTPVSYASGDRLRSIMGYRPSTNVTRPNFRTAARNEHGELTNLLFREWLTLMVAIDGGTLNSQAAFSIGLCNCSAWDYASLRKTGRSAVFGNQSGEILADETEETGADLDLLTMKDSGTIWNAAAQADHNKRVVSFCWRGFEDIWGACWEFADGCQKYQNDVAADDFTQSGYWVTNDVNKYVSLDTDKGAGQQGEEFPSRGYTGDSAAWVWNPFPKASGYIKTFDEKSFLVLTTGGGETTYFGDYWYNDANAGARVLVVGGLANNTSRDGVGYVAADYGLGFTSAAYGARLAASA